MSDIEKNKQVVRDYFAALNTFGIAALMDVITQDITFNVPGSSCLSGTYTLETLPKLVKYLGQACPEGIKFDITELTAEADRVSCMVVGHGRMPDGGVYNNHYHFLLRIKDGKICQTHEYMDTLLVENVFGPLVKQT